MAYSTVDKAKRSLLYIAAIMPILGVIGTAFLWLDTRYMHRQISDNRYIEMQILVLERSIEDYEDDLNAGVKIKPEDKRDYQLEVAQLESLLRERNKLLGIGK